MARKTEDQIETMGRNAGLAAARKFVTGTRSDRRAIRAKFVATRWSDAAYWVAHHGAFMRHLEVAADHIKSGRLPRMIRPTRIYAVINRVA